jgi:AraC-like DNA-binding protein
MSSVSLEVWWPHDPVSATVLVSHPYPLICAGLVSALQRMPQCRVRVCSDAQALWHSRGLTMTGSGAAARPRGGLPPGALRRVRDHVEAHLSEKIELRDLAAIAGLSACHFSRAFKQSMGKPPHRYLMTRRIAAAAELIEKTDQTMTEISLEVGFSDQSHFTRVFLGMTGETPRAFRRRHR